MQIRDIEIGDLIQLKHLLNQLVETEVNEDVLEVIVGRVFANEAYNMFGLFDGDKLVATVSLIKGFDVTGDGTDFYILENFVVDGDYRRKGIGTLLLQYVEDFIRRHKGRSVIFTSSAVRKDAHDFYYRNGYKQDFVKGFKKYFDR